MPVQCFWDDDAKTIYCVHMHDTWTWDEFTNAVKESYAMLGKLDYRVDFVMGFLSSLPEDGSAMMPLTYAGENQPPNIRHTVMLNATGRATTMFMQSIIGAVDAVNEWVGPKFVESMEECRQYLQELRAKEE
jgi:hypothetical protein